MDNQQGKTEEGLKHWFAGFFDGEGTIFVGRTQYKGGGEYYSPKLSICNTDIPTLQVAEKALEAFGVPYHVQWNDGQKRNHARRWMINIAGWKRSLKASQAFLEYLRTKRHQCEDMVELCTSRLGQNVPKGYKHVPHTTRQLELISQLRGKGRFRTFD